MRVVTGEEQEPWEAGGETAGSVGIWEEKRQRKSRFEYIIVRKIKPEMPTVDTLESYNTKHDALNLSHTHSHSFTHKPQLI